jgi:hypothetical protein
MPKLPQIAIATSCPAKWEDMTGDDRVRHCDLCQRNVYNLTALTTAEAVELVEQTEGRLCVRLYKRRDGNLLTAECPVGVRLAWARVAGPAASAIALGLTIVSLASAGLFESSAAKPTAFAEAWKLSKGRLVKVLPGWLVPASWVSPPPEISAE